MRDNDNIESENIIIHHAIYTSGEGGDYRVTAASKRLRNEEITRIERHALVKYYFSPDVKFENAIRIFPINHQTMALSYVTEAGRDEFGRPARFRAHILLIPNELFSELHDPRVFQPYFIEQDVFTNLEPICLNLRDFYANNIISLYQIRDRLHELLKIFDDDMLNAIFYGIFTFRKTLIIPSNDITIESIFSSTKITSMDILVALFQFTPRPILNQMIVSSLILNGEMEQTVISFLHPYGMMPQKDAFIIDLETKETYSLFKGKKIPKKSFIIEYIKLIKKYTQEENYQLIESAMNFFGSGLLLLDKLGKKGARLIQKILDFVYESHALGVQVDKDL